LLVNEREFVLRGGMTIVSTTGPKGKITYVNDDFLEAAGFTEAELIGQPHNIVRHPESPEEAFRDLRDTLKAGKPWTGLVKNRRWTGDYHWVLANATPVLEGVTVTGYMSLRTRPSREQVNAAVARFKTEQGEAGQLAPRRVAASVERRGLNRAKNVSRIAPSASKGLPKSLPAPAKTGTDDEWQEF
jgi:PAS domain S-box-containing protein